MSDHEAVTVEVVVVLRRNAGKSRALDAVQSLPGDAVAVGGFRRTVFTAPGAAGDNELRQLANNLISGANAALAKIRKAAPVADA